LTVQKKKAIIIGSLTSSVIREQQGTQSRIEA